VGSYSGLGIHSLFSIQQTFPGHFKNVLFVSVGVIDSATMKGIEEVDRVAATVEKALADYQELAHRMGFATAARMTLGTEVVDSAVELCSRIAREFPRSVFFASKLVFREEHWYQSILHNETAYSIQRRLQLAGLQTVVLPVRILPKRRSA